MNELKEFVEDCDRIKLKKFFQFRSVDSTSNLTDLPEDYREFLLKFGEVDLIRDPVTPSHYLRVHSPAEELSGGVSKVRVGYQIDLGHVFLNQNGSDWQVTSHRPGAKMGKSWNSFTEWFLAAYRKSKKTLSAADWKKAQLPAEPFSPAERRIVDARRRFSVSLVGAKEPNSVVLRVVNDSDQTLTRYTFGMRMPGGMDGWVSVSVSGIRPGQSVDVIKETYHSGALEKLEIYDLPDPQPEDRDYYFEFSAPQENGRSGSSCESPADAALSANDSAVNRSTKDPKLGDWKFSEEVSLEDLLQHPIWLWCCHLSTDEDGENGLIDGNESSMRPWLQGDDVTIEMDSPMILFRVDGTDRFARGVYSAVDELLEGLSVFWNGDWIKVERLGILGPVRRYTAIPSILGEEDCQFISDGADLTVARQVFDED